MSSLAPPAPAVKARRAKPPRTVKLLCLPPLGLGTLRITEKVGRKTTTGVYYFRRVPADFGQGFLVTKPDGTVYHVNVAGKKSTCECKGFLRWGHCKHVEVLEALTAAGKLAPSTNGRA